MHLGHFVKGSHQASGFIGLLDNQQYVFEGLLVTNPRLPSRKQRLSEPPKRRTKPEHYDDKIWHFLNWVSHGLKETLKVQKASALVLFNHEDYEHNTGDSFIHVNGTHARNFTLTTGNLIGFVKRGDYSLKISSRFGDAFLKYMVADADGFLELENNGGERHADGYDWLLAYQWNIKLKKACRLGLPKAYITKNERISRARGTIDTLDYFQNRASGTYLCAYREHNYDSPATSLFIKAYEAVEHYTFCQHTRRIYHALLTANQGIKRTRQEILRTPYFTHPFYQNYNVLIDLSKQVINQQGTDFSTQQDTSAFFFDIAMLFEYFIRKLLQREGMTLHGKGLSEQRCEIPAGAMSSYQRKLEPDLVFEQGDGLYIFDVKYKTFDSRFGVKREDLFQLHTYIGQYGNGSTINGCGFIYPISEARWQTLNLEQSQGIISDSIRQQGTVIPFHILFLKIPPENTFSNAMMRKYCNHFCRLLHDYVFIH